MRIAHLSDLHFGRHDDAAAQSLIADITSQAPDLIVISGDFTQIGSKSEFSAAREFMDRLPQKVMAVPGNHDVPAFNLIKRLTDPYDRYREFIDGELEPLVVVDGVALAGLKTARRARFGLNWSHGSISKAQLTALEQRFEQAPAHSTRVVVAHHPLLFPDEIMQKPMSLVRHADRALEKFAELGVRLILSGHFHMSYVRRYGDPGEVRIAAPSGPRRAAAAPIVVAQASTAISTRTRGHGNAYNLITIGTDQSIHVDVREWLESGWTVKEEGLVAAQ